MSRPLRSTLITRASSLLRAGPPARCRIGTQHLTVSPAWCAPFTSTPAFPRSVQTPQTGLTPPSCRTPPGQLTDRRQTPSQDLRYALVPMSTTHFDTSAVVHSRSSFRSPPDTSQGAFSSSLTTTVFSQRSMRWFDISPVWATPKGHKTFIICTAQLPEVSLLQPLSALVAHTEHMCEVGDRFSRHGSAASRTVPNGRQAHLQA